MLIWNSSQVSKSGIGELSKTSKPCGRREPFFLRGELNYEGDNELCWTHTMQDEHIEIEEVPL